MGGVAYIINISLYESLASRGIDVVQDLIQQDNLDLKLVQLSEGLRAVVGFRVGVCTGQRLHELLRRGEVSRRTPANELLQLRRLGLAILCLQLLRGLEILHLHHTAYSNQHHASGRFLRISVG